MSCMYVFPFDFSRWFCSHVSWHWWGALLETRSKVFENRQTPKRRCDEMYILPTVEFQGLLPRKFNDWNPKNDAVLNPESPCPLHLWGAKFSQSKLSTVGFIAWAMFKTLVLLVSWHQAVHPGPPSSAMDTLWDAPPTVDDLGFEVRFDVQRLVKRVIQLCQES